MYEILHNHKWLNHPKRSIIDKIECLRVAKSKGIDTPNTIITNSKVALSDFYCKHGKIITKPIYNIENIELNDNPYLQYTSIVNKKIIRSLPESFFPSLFQEYIEKEVEIRSFYLDGTFFSMAIFSQNNSQTAIDFRRYDYIKPNRRVPFQLPKDIEIKITELMNDLELNCGSVDIIKTSRGQYYFLEVNPVGQFGMVSYPCNYFIEERIAQYLI